MLRRLFSRDRGVSVYQPDPGAADDLSQELSIDQAVYAKSGVVSMPVSRRVRSASVDPTDPTDPTDTAETSKSRPLR